MSVASSPNGWSPLALQQAAALEPTGLGYKFLTDDFAAPMKAVIYYDESLRDSSGYPVDSGTVAAVAAPFLLALPELTADLESRGGDPDDDYRRRPARPAAPRRASRHESRGGKTSVYKSVPVPAQRIFHA